MFLIKRIEDPHAAARIAGSFGAGEPGAFAYGAFMKGEVLATAAFLTEPGGCVVFCGADTGKRLDMGLVDGLARAAFSAQRKAGAKTARLGDGLDREMKLALTKLGYGMEGLFSLEEFFNKKHCC